jgi:hypothetical protein
MRDTMSDMPRFASNCKGVLTCLCEFFNAFKDRVDDSFRAFCAKEAEGQFDAPVSASACGRVHVLHNDIYALCEDDSDAVLEQYEAKEDCDAFWENVMDLFMLYKQCDCLQPRVQPLVVPRDDVDAKTLVEVEECVKAIYADDDAADQLRLLKFHFELSDVVSDSATVMTAVDYGVVLREKLDKWLAKRIPDDTKRAAVVERIANVSKKVPVAGFVSVPMLDYEKGGALYREQVIARIERKRFFPASSDVAYMNVTTTTTVVDVKKRCESHETTSVESSNSADEERMKDDSYCMHKVNNTWQYEWNKNKQQKIEKEEEEESEESDEEEEDEEEESSEGEEASSDSQRTRKLGKRNHFRRPTLENDGKDSSLSSDDSRLFVKHAKEHGLPKNVRSFKCAKDGQTYVYYKGCEKDGEPVYMRHADGSVTKIDNDDNDA